MPGSRTPPSRPEGATLAAESEPPSAATGAEGKPKTGLLFDITDVDFSARFKSREQIAEWNPHRGHMALLDWIVWQHPDRCRGVGLKHLRGDEFWVPGHFPERPMFPGVLMIEAGAQLACYLYISRRPETSLVAFLRIEQAAFRATVGPGEDLYLLCDDVKVGRRNFTCDIQGLMGPAPNRKIAFDARVSGMMID